MGIHVIGKENFSEYIEKIEVGVREFIPMLPFIKAECHDFSRYKIFNPNAIYLIDYMDNDYCLYHLYRLKESEDTLRISLVLPSNWNRRVEIIEKSVPNLKEWFISNDKSRDFIIQILEHGEIEYYPTLSHYLIPTILKSGFVPQYKMYMKRDKNLPLPTKTLLPSEYTRVGYTEDILDEVLEFYYGGTIHNSIVDYNKEEILDLCSSRLFKDSAVFVKDKDNRIVGGLFASKDDYWSDETKIWIGNFAVLPTQQQRLIQDFLLSETIDFLRCNYSNHDIVIYMDRTYRNQIEAYERYDFAPFEFWVEAILKK